MLALAVGAGVPAADAIATSGGGGSKTTHAKKKKKKPKRKAASSSQTRGAKGDKGDKGDPGAKGDKGDPGSSVVNRTRLAGPTSTGDGDEPTAVPLTGSSWTAAPDEADDWAGSVTFTLPTACDDQQDPTSVLPPPLGGYSEPGGAAVLIKLDGRDYVGDAYTDWSGSEAGKSVTVPIRFSTGRTLNGDAPTTHTFTAETSDWCGSTGQSFTITDLRINVSGSR